MESKFAVSSSALFSVASVLAYFSWMVWLEIPTWSQVLLSIALGFSAFFVSLLGLVFLYISFQRTPPSLPMASVFRFFLVSSTGKFVGNKKARKYYQDCRQVRMAQEQLLKDIIAKNKDTEYGRNFQLQKICCLNDLREKHPTTKFEHYKSYVQRIAKGERSVMSNGNVTRLVLTSGTTGQGKWIPTDINRRYPFFSMIRVILSHHFPNVQQMDRQLRIHINGSLKKSEGGITIGPVLALEPAVTKFMLAHPTPPDGFLITTVREAFYVHLLFGLADNGLASFSCPFSSTIQDVCRFLENNWRKLADDLAHGTLNPDLQLPVEIRNSLTQALGPGDPHRAEEVRRECMKGSVGLLKRLWPRMEFVAAVDNVGLKDYLIKTECSGLYFVSPLFVCSEGVIGVNLHPKNNEVEYSLAISDNVFEFIPEGQMDQANPCTFFADELEVGKNYELLLTQADGFYRYRMGDVIKVTGFHHQCPKVIFLYRTATLLNLVGEKVDQVEVQNSLNAALSLWPELKLANYCVAENSLLTGLNIEEYTGNTEKTMSHYVFFLELQSTNEKMESPDVNILAERIDNYLYENHAFFRNFKDGNFIDTPLVHLVKPGSFEILKDYIVANSTASILQYKLPQKLRTKEMAKVMLENVIQHK